MAAQSSAEQRVLRVPKLRARLRLRGPGDEAALFSEPGLRPGGAVPDLDRVVVAFIIPGVPLAVRGREGCHACNCAAAGGAGVDEDFEKRVLWCRGSRLTAQYI